MPYKNDDLSLPLKDNYKTNESQNISGKPKITLEQYLGNNGRKSEFTEGLNRYGMIRSTSMEKYTIEKQAILKQKERLKKLLANKQEKMSDMEKKRNILHILEHKHHMKNIDVPYFICQPIQMLESRLKRFEVH